MIRLSFDNYGCLLYDIISSGRSLEKIKVHHIITSITVQIMNEQRAQAYVNL
jgi:hypothetical protein